MLTVIGIVSLSAGITGVIWWIMEYKKDEPIVKSKLPINPAVTISLTQANIQAAQEKSAKEAQLVNKNGDNLDFILPKN